MAPYVEKLDEIEHEPEEQGESFVLFATIIALLLLALINGL